MILQSTGVDNSKVFHGELIAFKEDCGYITYVFKNLDECDALHQYLMCVRFPNWECGTLNIGDKGFVKFREVIAGIDKWYDSDTDTFVPYKFTDIHFLSFIFDKPKKDTITL